MKRDMNDLDLRRAFAPMPDSCRDALLTTACSVKDEKRIKRTSLHAVLIAAVIIVITMAVALAATQLGWVDFYRDYDGIAVPKAAQEVLNATAPRQYQAGPMTFTFNQLLADGKIVLSAAEIRTTDGAEVLYTPWEPFESVNALSDTVMNKYGLKPGTTWVEAAQQLQLPLYCIRASLEVDGEYSDGWGMEDPLWNEDGSIIYFSMWATNPHTTKDVLPVTLYMAVMEFDPVTGEEKEKWTVREAAEISVSGILAEKTYKPESTTELNGMTLIDVRAELCVTGAYLYTSFTASEGMDEDTATQQLYGLVLCDSTGKELPHGINLSSGSNMDALPTVVLESMITADALPDSLIVTDGTISVTVK